MTAFEERMKALRRRFQDRAADAHRRIVRALDPLDQAELRIVSHQLAGIAAIFGHPQVGDAAERVEAALDEALLDAELSARSNALLEALAPIIEASTAAEESP